MLRNLIKLGMLVGVAAALASCKHDNNNTGTVGTTSPPASAPYSQFGAGFATDIAASNTSTPAQPTQADVNPVDPTAQPQPVS